MFDTLHFVNPDGSVIRMKDVARVETGAKSQDRHSRFNGAPTAAIGIYQSPGSNVVDVTHRVADSGRQRPRCPASPAAKPRKLKTIPTAPGNRICVGLRGGGCIPLQPVST
jgi:hypothetical protein